MGAAIATLIAMRLADEEQEVGGVYTFGAPRLVQWDMQASYNAQLGELTYNFANDKDPVPRFSMNLLAVGKNFLFDGQTLRQVDKNGIPDWGLAGIIWGDIRAHWTRIDLPNGYLNSVRLFR